MLVSSRSLRIGLVQRLLRQVRPVVEPLGDPGRLAHRIAGAHPGDRLRLGDLQAEIGAHDVHHAGLPLRPGDLRLALRPAVRAEAQHVEVDGPGVRAVVAAEPGGDHRAPVAALGEVGLVAQHLGHQGVEQPRRGPLADRPPGLRGEAEAGQGRDDQVEGVGGLAAEAAGEGQLLDRLPELVVRARPAVGDDQRPLAAGLADHMQEVEVEVLDPGGELRKAVEVGHRRAPVVGAGPVVAEALQTGAVAAIGPAVRGRPGSAARDRRGPGPARPRPAASLQLTRTA